MRECNWNLTLKTTANTFSHNPFFNFNSKRWLSKRCSDSTNFLKVKQFPAKRQIFIRLIALWLLWNEPSHCRFLNHTKIFISKMISERKRAKIMIQFIEINVKLLIWLMLNCRNIMSENGQTKLRRYEHTTNHSQLFYLENFSTDTHTQKR